MSKARKRLIVRLSIVSVVVGLGVFALVQAQMRDSHANDGDDPNGKPKAPAMQTPATTRNGKTATTRNEKTKREPSVAVAPAVYYDATVNLAAGQFDSAAESESTRGGEFPGLASPPFLPPARQVSKDEPVEHSSGGQFVEADTSMPETTRFQSDDAETYGEDGEFRRFDEPPSFAPPGLRQSETNENGASVRVGSAAETSGAYQPNIDRSTLAAPGSFQNAENANFSGEQDAYQGTSVGTQTDAPPATSPRQLEPHGADVNQSQTEPRSVISNRDHGVFPPPVSAQAMNFNSAGTPGPQHLEGVRSPSLVLEKRAPQEIQVGKSATFEIHVQNTGQVDANNVVVADQVPRGTDFVDASPAPETTHDGELLWKLGTLRPGDEKTISIQLIPTEEGEIGSVARLAFETEASVKTICTRPQLAIELSSPPRVLIGENITHTVKISNPGTGDATGVTLEEDVPDGFAHPAGNQLEFEVGTLRPGESREVKLTLKAEQAGAWENALLVRGDGNLVQEDVVRVEVIAPGMNLVTRGPTKRYLERPATYEIHVDNPGTAPANDIELVAFLHKGMKFVETNNHGQYDPQHHAVYWSLDQLPAQQQGAVELTVLPVETGEQRLRVEGRAKLGLEDQQDHLLQVDGLAALFFDVADVSDPIEVGSDTVYHVRVLNQGSKTATNVQVVATVPAGMQAIGGEGPTRHEVQGQVIAFEPLSRLAPKSDALYKIQVRGVRPGDQRIKVQLTSDDFRTPITKEESTRVYSDR